MLGAGTDQSVVVMIPKLRDCNGNGAKGLTHSVLSTFTTRKRMIEFEKTKSLPITKEMVCEAYLQVRRKGKSAGVDDLSMSPLVRDCIAFLHSLQAFLTKHLRQCFLNKAKKI